MTETNKDAEIELLKAELTKSEKRAILFGDLLHQNIIAMRAAIVAGKLEGLEQGLQWIANTLEGPGHLPDLDEARVRGGAQAMFDAEMAEHEEFRATHQLPENPSEWISSAIKDVLAERRRQVVAEGWTPRFDDERNGGELACAAACYAFNAAYPGSPLLRTFWPWSQSWWKPTTPRRDLVKAGALILAEIERLDRIKSPKNGA